jgi:hypothetical protein
MVDRERRIVAMGARVHLFIRPERRAAFTALFRDVLGCAVAELDFGMGEPILLVSFPDGSAFSVESTDLAPDVTPESAPTDETAPRGAWIEFRTPDVAGLEGALRAAGLPEFRHPGSRHTYFVAPGGQVFRLLDVAYKGP